MDNDWRPKDWASIKRNIVAEAVVTWSPSKGYSPDQKERLIELTASIIIKELVDAGFIQTKPTMLKVEKL